MKFFLFFLFIISCQAHFSIKPNETLTIIQPSILSHDSQELEVNLILTSPFECNLLFEVIEGNERGMVDKQILVLSGTLIFYQRSISSSKIFLSFQCLNEKVNCILGIDQRKDEVWIDINLILLGVLILLPICVLLLVYIQRNQALEISRISGKV